MSKIKFFPNNIIRFFKKKKTIVKSRSKHDRTLKINTRSASIPGILKNYIFEVHKGNATVLYRNRKVISLFKSGSLAFTRKPFYYPRSLKKKK